MSNYTKATNFAAKDALLTGDPLKVVNGTELDDEFNAIQTAVNSKANVNNAVLTGTPTAPTASAGASNNQIATTSFVNAERTNAATLTNKTLVSPTLTGTPVAPTASANTNTTQVATTAHVYAERSNAATLTNKTLASPVLTGTPTAPTASAGSNTTQVATTAFVGTATANMLETSDIGSTVQAYAPTITQAEAEAGTVTDVRAITPERIKQAILALAPAASASELLASIKTVDGSGSGLDADTLDGFNSSYFYPASNPNGYLTGSSTTFGAVGSYAFLVTWNTTNVAVGATRSGSQLWYTNSAKFQVVQTTAMTSSANIEYFYSLNNDFSVSGTWRNMGPGISDASENTPTIPPYNFSDTSTLNLWVRIA